MFKGSRLAGKLGFDKLDYELRSDIIYAQKELAYTGDFDGELFRELADECLLGRLSDVHLPPRKFPHPTVPLVEWTLANQVLAPTLNYRSDNACFGSWFQV